MSDILERPVTSEHSASESAREWNAFYRAGSLTDWEMLNPNDLRETLSAVVALSGGISTAIEIGSGRGLRTLAAILGAPGLNRAGFALRGVEHSDAAVRFAKAFSAVLARGEGLPPPFGDVIRKTQPKIGEPLRAHVEFVCADLFAWLGDVGNAPAELVIDWMCLHEILPELRPAYAELIAAKCERYFVLNTFSVEGATLTDLGCVGAKIQKFQLSRAEIEDLFGHSFRIVSVRLIPEDLDPHPRPSDGIVAAKCIYVLERKAPEDRFRLR